MCPQKIILRGIGASPGMRYGKVKLVKSLGELEGQDFETGDILVTRFATPLLISLILKAGAIVTDYGGATSHAATVARELGIPCVVGTEQATQVLKEGMVILVNGQTGEISQQ